MNKEQITKKQHYVPRFILGKHHIIKPHKDNLIYQYDKQSESERIAPIKSVSFAKNLYEFHDEKGLNEKTRNNIEKWLHQWETEWGRIIKNIENYERINEHDLIYLYCLFPIQILRLPIIQQIGVSLYQSLFDSPRDAHNYVLYKSLAGMSDEQVILRFFMEQLSNYQLFICYADDVLTLGGEVPIIGNPDISSNQFTTLSFPVTPHLCLQLKKKHQKCFRLAPKHKKMTRKEVKLINTLNIDGENGRFVYSSVPFDQILHENKKY